MEPLAVVKDFDPFKDGCSGTLNVLWQLLSDCRQANPSCRIINLNVEQVDIPDAIHLRLCATEGMTQLDAALNLV